MTDVVAALIWDGNRFLACQRPAHKARGLLWEFVGGKVESGESLQDALIRECSEELDITLSVGSIFMSLVHEYPDLTVRLTLFNATILEGVPQKLEHNDIRWITTAEIDCYNFCPADVEILARLKTIENGLQAELLSLSDSEYKVFQCNLMPTVDPDTIIGVRMPILRKFAKKMIDTIDGNHFLNNLPHRFYEENNLHGILLSNNQSYSQTIDQLDMFLPYVNNWATCDLISPASFRSCPIGLLEKVQAWLIDEHPYTVRFAIGVLMKYYLDVNFDSAHLHWVAEIQRDEYYIKMMQAWYFATALAKQYNATIPLLKDSALSPWVHKKTIQKALESYRIPDYVKAELKVLRN